MTESATLEQTIVSMAQDARIASFSLMSLSSERKNAVLKRMADLLQSEKDYIQAENDKDLLRGREKGLSAAMLNRLELSDAVMAAMIAGLNEICLLADPVGEIRDLVKRPNGLMVGRMRVPLGVIAMIYESRPNVTVDAAALCLKTGNAILLRGGSEAIHSNMALAKILQEALAAEEIDEHAIQVIPVTDRQAVNVMLAQEQYIDLVIPRGGESLIRFVAETSKIPVLKHYKGVCHIFRRQGRRPRQGDTDYPQLEGPASGSLQRPGRTSSASFHCRSVSSRYRKGTERERSGTAGLSALSGNRPGDGGRNRR